MLVLFSLPVILAALVKLGAGLRPPRDPLLWAAVMGVDVKRSSTAGTTGLFSLSSVFGWWWLIVGLYAGDLLAGDMGSGLARLVLARGVSRRSYLLGKLLAAQLFLLAVALIGGVIVVASSRIVAGPQERIPLALALSAAIGLGSFPLLALGALVGLRARSSLAGVLSVFAAYFLTALLVAVGVVLAVISRGGGDVLDPSMRAAALLPLDGGLHLARALYGLLVYGPWVHVGGGGFTVPGPRGEIVLYYGGFDARATSILASIGTAAWGAGLTLLALWLLERSDL